MLFLLALTMSIISCSKNVDEQGSNNSTENGTDIIVNDTIVTDSTEKAEDTGDNDCSESESCNESNSESDSGHSGVDLPKVDF